MRDLNRRGTEPSAVAGNTAAQVQVHRLAIRGIADCVYFESMMRCEPQGSVGPVEPGEAQCDVGLAGRIRRPLDGTHTQEADYVGAQ